MLVFTFRINTNDDEDDDYNATNVAPSVVILCEVPDRAAIQIRCTGTKHALRTQQMIST